MSDYTKFFTKERIRSSSVGTQRTLLEESYSDRSRIVFSSAFRRLQQKAQVFSLEKNTYVRSRMTHSIEVSDYGKGIATKAGMQLVYSEHLDKDELLVFINVVENACFLHDIGNPPFGHFGEAAIKKWFEDNWKTVYNKSTEKKTGDECILEEYIHDFLEFDGNPQGFRIITKLQGRPEDIEATGLNLTLMQLYCFLKYIRKADGDESGSGILKKAGYFNSEKEIVKKIMTEIDHTKRYPLVYIMEAADDIAYCLSDIEDGLEKNILTFDRFKAALIKQWKKETKKDVLPYNLLSKEGDSYFTFKTTLARRLIEESVFIYVKEHDDFLKGERDELLSEESSSDAFYILKALKNISRLLLFRSPEAEKKEIAGFQIIKGLMEKFKPILELSKSEFDKLLEGRNDPYKCKNLDVEWRFFNILPKKYVKVYEAELQKEKLKSYSNEDIIQLEWFYRAHLIVDFVAGMTDNYSLEVYKLFNGIEIN